MKRSFKVALSLMLLVMGLQANDLLSKATGGSISNSSDGVKELSEIEMKNVLGGYAFKRASQYDWRGYMPSTAYIIVSDNSSEIKPSLVDGAELVGKIRVGTSGKKQYYLEVYKNGISVGAYAGRGYSAILTEFQKRY